MPESTDLDDVAKVELVRDGYDRIAEDYLRLAGESPDSHPRRQRPAMLLAAIPAGSQVLELGCGAGMPVAAEILRNGHTYTGVDISARQVELAMSQLPDGDFRVGNVLDQAFDADAFDAVLALYVMTHIPREQWGTLLARIFRWLKPHGTLLLNVPHGDSAGWLEQDFLGFGGTNWTNAYGAETTVGILEAEGLRVVDATALADDDSSPNGWVWLTAVKLRWDAP